MLKNILNNILKFWTNLNRRGRAAILVLVAIALFLPVIAYFLRNTSNVTQSQQDSISVVRDEIEKLGNPFAIPKKQILTKYPFIVNKKLKDGLLKNVYLIDVNTSMLLQDEYKELFESAESIRSSLTTKPYFYSDQYQMFYDADTSQPLNPTARMLNFFEVKPGGVPKWFSEEGGEFWVSDTSTESNSLKKLIVNKAQLPQFQKLQRIGDAKLLWTTKSFDTAELTYNSLEIFSDNTTRIKSGTQDFTFLEVPKITNDPTFIGSYTSGDLLPNTYGINSNYVLNKTATTAEAIITFTNISDIQSPQRVTDKEIKIREVNSVYITCAIEVEKCWIFNPGIKSIKEINGNLNIADLKPSRDIELSKISEANARLFDKDRMLRFNQESNELLFFYEGSWKSIYRY
jgi:hypothetical protein